MATHTLVTASSLTAITYNQSPNVLLPADLATVTNSIKNDFPNISGVAITPSTQTAAGNFSYMGLLVLPGGRGEVKLYPGDVVAVDNQGWPIVVSKYSIANGNWTFT